MKVHPVTTPLSPLSLSQASAGPWQRLMSSNLVRLTAWFGLQAALGYGCRHWAIAATAHATLTIAVALWAALLSRKSLPSGTFYTHTATGLRMDRAAVAPT